jgi:ABC-type transport system involved in multi-copper enzyme maturation permease subunit
MATVSSQQARSGFWTLLARENKVWWGSKRWLLQILVGVAGLGGFLAFTLFALPRMVEATGESLDALEAGAQIFFGLGALAFAIDVIILTQNSIIGEKQSGIAEWVLSKPVSRPTYILAKVFANSLGVVVTLILIPGVVAYTLFTLAGAEMPLANFAAAMGLLALHTLFYLALSLMMGVIAESQGALLAVTLGSVLGGAVLVDFIGRLAFVTPWLLGNIAVGVAQDVALPPIMWLPVAATALLTLSAIAVAIWRFETAEL